MYQKFLIILPVVWGILVLGCNGGSGDGEAPTYDYSIFLQTVPISYDPNFESLLKVKVKPDLKRQTGNFVLFFEIYKSDDNSFIGQSNWFYYWDDDPDTDPAEIALEWGGGDHFLLTGANENAGKFYIVAYLEKYDENFPGKNAQRLSYSFKKSKEITIKKYNYQNYYYTINVEMDQQDRVFFWEDFSTATVREAFNPTHKQFVFIDDELDLKKKYIVDDETKVYEYIQQHKNDENKYYLCGIAGFVFSETDQRLTSTLGRTVIKGSNEENVYGSLIGMDNIDQVEKISAFIETDYFYWAAQQTVVIHELGHQLGLQEAEHNYDNHNGNIYCVMYKGIYRDFSDDTGDQYSGRTLMTNPHFCERHVEILLSIVP